MEDKELKQLIDAKRTTEANRRRQEQLARMIEAEGAPKSRRLWPIWAGGIAASIVLGLMTLPVLMRSEATEPTLIAQTEVPAVAEEDPVIEEPAPAPQPKPGTATRTRRAATAKPIALKEEAEESESTSEMLPESTPTVIEKTVSAPAEAPTPAAPPKPRIHRRTSTRMVSVQEARRKEGGTASQMLAGIFGPEESSPLTLKTIDLS